MTRRFDVIVIGGGPAGISAARSAAGNGVRTLLLEKKSEIGSPIICGEFIPSATEMKKLLPCATNLHEHYERLVSDACSNRVETIRLHVPWVGCREFSFDGIVVDRKVLEKNLVAAAEENGAEVLTSCVARQIVDRREVKKVEVTTRGQSAGIESKLVIGADGFPSRVGSWLGLKSGYDQNDMVLCLHFLVKGGKLEDHVVEMFFGREYAPGGFGWIIPKGSGEANVGVGIRLSQAGHVTIRELGTRFLRQHAVASRSLRDAEILFSSAKLVPVGGIARDVSGSGVLLAGDAAGLAIPTNGGGIPSAIASGLLAGDVAAQSILEGIELKTYDEMLRNQLGGEVQTGLAYRRAGDLFMGSDLLFGCALHLIGTKLLMKVIKCETGLIGSFLRLIL